MKYLFIILITPQLWADQIQFIGRAYTLDQKQLLYIEEHQVENDSRGFNLKISTAYLTPQKKVFAQIKSDFSKDKYIPDVVFEDFRFQKKQEIFYNIQSKEIEVKETFLDKNKVKKNSFKVQKDMVAGQGFNNYLLDHFDSFQDKNTILPIQFIVIAVQDFFAFDIFKSEETDLKMTFGLKVHNVFYKLFVSELLTEYDKKSKRLLSFKGLSNISDDQQKTQKVHISYEYPDDKK